ncbi:HipA domain-containing protein [Amphritea balenae]|uniref:Type II toxin-antitoxin system HipA family toxin n=1 Tax=Amphritea balenae TaxID=452629 RepID=A0A3P1SVV4_9GAMM|nr:HipA domain-containing protein [Amphritea balenae]RRD01324.1 type II toxin-antitoxin system HipA family toxin [Amphritea balenae]GGK58127.1 putative kinase Y4mE [Amphritea balenae]
MPDPRTLNVWCNQELVGKLTEANNLWQFEYSANWHDFNLSPDLTIEAGTIADGGTIRPVQWFFDNLLPEEGARSLMADDANINQADAFSLLAHFGAESAGALTLLQEDEISIPAEEQPLPQQTLSERIKQLPHIPLSTGSSKRMSLAGAQHKLPIIYRDGKLFEPIGATPSTHILKPDHSDPEQYPHSAVNEWFIMQLAERIGLTVPDTFLIYVPEPVYLVARFDREKIENQLLRQHILDGCQLLTLANTYKYSQCNSASLDRLIEFSRSKAVTRQRLLQWLLFNLLVGNTDDHLKNLSFYAANQDFNMTPHYDLISTAVYANNNKWGEENLVWPIGEARQLNQISLADIQAVGASLKLSQRYVERTIKAMTDNITKHADSLIEELSQQNNSGPGRQGEIQLLRKIRYGVIEDMIRQLDNTL